MTADFARHDFVSVVGTSATTGDKLTWSPPVACVIKRWGVVATALIDVGAGAVLALDVIPKSGGTRVNGSVSGGFDVAGGTISTSTSDVTAGTGLYHEPHYDPSRAVSPGTGVSTLGNQLLILPGDTAVIEVTDAADTAGATTTFFIEYLPLPFIAARDTVMVNKAS